MVDAFRVSVEKALLRLGKDGAAGRLESDNPADVEFFLCIFDRVLFINIINKNWCSNFIKIYRKSLCGVTSWYSIAMFSGTYIFDDKAEDVANRKLRSLPAPLEVIREFYECMYTFVNIWQQWVAIGEGKRRKETCMPKMADNPLKTYPPIRNVASMT